MTIYWGILGAGKIAESQMAPAIAAVPGHELVAVSRRSLDAAQEFADRHGAQRAYASAEELLDDDQVNAVYVATPPHLHARETVLAAEAGKHVLCEKPMALTTAEAREMIEACRVNGVVLTICHYQRFNARHQRIRSLVEGGAIGQVTAARINFSDRFPPQPGVWHHNPEISGGGPVMDLGIHCIDLLRYLCGPAESVAALMDTLVDDSPVDDTATLLLRLDSGAQAVTYQPLDNGQPCAGANERAGNLGHEGLDISRSDFGQRFGWVFAGVDGRGDAGLCGRARWPAAARGTAGGIWRGRCRRRSEPHFWRGGAGWA